MKLCYVNINAEETSEPLFRLLDSLFHKVLRADTEVSIKSVAPGLNRALDLHPYFYFLNKRSIIERIIEAEKEGFDAAVVGCFWDPGVREARATVNIPVIGIGEASMLFACFLGDKFAIVSLNEPSLLPEIDAEIKAYGLEQRTISNPVRSIKMSTYDVFTKGMENPTLVAQDVLERTKECVADRADVVIVGCNGLGPLCTLTNVVKVEDGDVPILDCTSIGLKMAESIHEISGRLGIPFRSRATVHALPKQKDLKRVRQLFGLEST